MRSEARDTKHTILKVLVGSQAHGLAGPESDADYRSVFVVPTAEMFRVGYRYQGARMIKSVADESAWEIGLFLSLAAECQPLILETFLAPVVTMDHWGEELRSLFPSVWSPQRAYESFVGYALNQRKKFLEKKDGRPAKYAAASIRVLYNLCELLETGRFTIRIADTPIGKTIADLKDAPFRAGEVIDLAELWTEVATGLLSHCRHEADPKVLDHFLIRVRKAFLS